MNLYSVYHQDTKTLVSWQWQRGETVSRIHFLLIEAADPQRTFCNGSRQHLGQMDIIGVFLRSQPSFCSCIHLCGPQLGGIEIGIGGRPPESSLYSFTHLANLFVDFVCYGAEWGCFNHTSSNSKNKCHHVVSSATDPLWESNFCWLAPRRHS